MNDQLEEIEKRIDSEICWPQAISDIRCLIAEVKRLREDVEEARGLALANAEENYDLREVKNAAISLLTWGAVCDCEDVTEETCDWCKLAMKLERAIEKTD